MHVIAVRSFTMYASATPLLHVEAYSVDAAGVFTVMGIWTVRLTTVEGPNALLKSVLAFLGSLAGWRMVSPRRTWWLGGIGWSE